MTLRRQGDAPAECPMIIDLHTQVWSSVDQLGPDTAERVRARLAARWSQIDASPAAHEKAMDCVDGAVVIGFRSELLGARIPNEFIAEIVGRNPARLVGVAGVDPLAGDALDQVSAAKALKLVGVAVSPSCQGFHPAHSAAMRVYERCADAGLALFVTAQEPLTSRAVLELARPAAWDEVARAFPKLPIVISRLGWPWIDETLVLIAKHETVHADIAGLASRPWQVYNTLLTAASMGVMNKLLFASGFPYETPANAIETLYTLNAFSQGTQLPSIARSAIRSMVERDSLASLGIQSRIMPTVSAPEEEEESVDESEDALSGSGTISSSRRRSAAEDDVDS